MSSEKHQKMWMNYETYDELPIIQQIPTRFPVNQQTDWDRLGIFHGSLGSSQQFSALPSYDGLVQRAAAIFDVRVQAGRAGAS